MFLSARELIQELQWMDEGLAAIATWLVDNEIYGQGCAPVRNGVVLAASQIPISLTSLQCLEGLEQAEVLLATCYERVKKARAEAG